MHGATHPDQRPWGTKHTAARALGRRSTLALGQRLALKQVLNA